MCAIQISVLFAVCPPILGTDFNNYPKSKKNKVTVPRCIPSVQSSHAQNHRIVQCIAAIFFFKIPFQRLHWIS